MQPLLLRWALLVAPIAADYTLRLQTDVPVGNGEVLIEGEYTYSEGLFNSANRTAPLAYRMQDNGTVIYTTFHNEQQTTVDMSVILQEIILSL